MSKSYIKETRSGLLYEKLENKEAHAQSVRELKDRCKNIFSSVPYIETRIRVSYV